MEFQQIKTGDNNITIITDDVIQSIAKVDAFDDETMNGKLYEMHKMLLSIAKSKNNSYEVGIFINLLNTDEYYIIKGSVRGFSINDNSEVRRLLSYNPIGTVAVLHNHPRNGLFSNIDIKSFIDYESIYLMTAVCNDGTIYMMRKDEKFNALALSGYYNEGLISEEKYYNGIKNVARHAKEIGITYRCSVKRRTIV